MKIKLTERLKMVADMVRKGSTVTDVGTDHAYLPAYLVQNGICPRATASDLRHGPLENARETVENCGLESKITLCLSDGLDSIEQNAEQDILICGMGGTLMAQILGRANWIKDKRIRLILQPMTHAEDVRKYLCENGFEIIKEDVAAEDEKLYVAMCAEYTGQDREYSNTYYYFGELANCKNEYAEQYIVKLRKRLEKKYKALKESGKQEEEISRIELILKDTEGYNGNC